jgi:hypothetical protein
MHGVKRMDMFAHPWQLMLHYSAWAVLSGQMVLQPGRLVAGLVMGALAVCQGCDNHASCCGVIRLQAPGKHAVEVPHQWTAMHCMLAVACTLPYVFVGLCALCSTLLGPAVGGACSAGADAMPLVLFSSLLNLVAPAGASG